MNSDTNLALQDFANAVANFCNEVRGHLSGLEAEASKVDRATVELVKQLKYEELSKTDME